MKTPWASYQTRKIVGGACGGRELFPRHRSQRKPLVNDPDMHHGTCVTHVPWCMSGWLTRGGGENVSGILGACAIRNLRYVTIGPWGSFSCRSCLVSQNVRKSPDYVYRIWQYEVVCVNWGIWEDETVWKFCLLYALTYMYTRKVSSKNIWMNTIKIFIYIACILFLYMEV